MQIQDLRVQIPGRDMQILDLDVQIKDVSVRIQAGICKSWIWIGECKILTSKYEFLTHVTRRTYKNTSASVFYPPPPHGQTNVQRGVGDPQGADFFKIPRPNCMILARHCVLLYVYMYICIYTYMYIYTHI